MIRPIRAFLAGVATAALAVGLLAAGAAPASAAQNPSPTCRNMNESPFSFEKCSIEVSNPTITSAPFGQKVYPGFAWTIGSGWERTPLAVIDRAREVSLTVDWGDGTAPTQVERVSLDASVSPAGWYCTSIPTGNLCKTMSHIYARPGTYQVSYTARLHLEGPGENYFLEHTATTTATIASSSPQVAWTTKPPATALTQQTITAAWTVSGVDPAKPYSTFIDWGDGTREEKGALQTQPGQYSATHVYTAPGNYLPFIRAYPTGTNNLDMTQSQTSIAVTLDSATAPRVDLSFGESCLGDAGPVLCLGDQREVIPGGRPVKLQGQAYPWSAAGGPLTMTIDWGDGTVETYHTPCAGQAWCPSIAYGVVVPAPLPDGYTPFAFIHDYAERIAGRVVLTVTDANGLSTARAVDTTVTMRPQTISLAPLTDQVFPGADQTLTASSTSNLPVTLSTSGSCAIVDGSVRVTGAGGCLVSATQPGDAYFSPAEPVTQTFFTAKGTDVVFFNPILFPTYGGPDLGFSAVARAPIFYEAEGGCTIVGGNMLHPVAAGPCSVTAHMPGDANWEPGESVTRHFTVAQASQSITFDDFGPLTFGGADVALAAVSSAELPVTFTASGSCTVTGTSLHADQGGECVVTARQSGDANVAAAQDVSRTVQIAKAAQTLSFDAPASMRVGTASLTGSSSSGLPVAYTATGACSVTGATLTATASGSCTVTARQAGDARYLAAADIARTIAVVATTKVELGVLPTTVYRGGLLLAVVRVTSSDRVNGTVELRADGAVVATTRLLAGYGLVAVPAAKLPKGKVTLTAVHVPATADGARTTSSAVTITVR